MVRDGKGGGGVAFHVGEQFWEGGLVDESRDDEAGIVEDALDGNVGGGFFDLVNVVDAGGEGHGDGAEF